MGLLNFLKPLSEKRIWERRKNPRIASYLKTDYQIRGGPFHANCFTHDISEGGICLNVYQRIEVGANVKVGIYFPDVAEPAWAFGKLVWERETPGQGYPYQAGIEFNLFASSLPSRIQNHIHKIKDLATA